MSPAVTLVLDNEAVRALLAVEHPKHKRVLSFLDETNRRVHRRAATTLIVVPVAVRIEAGWDRTNPASANVNRMSRTRDVVLDSAVADRASRLRQAADVFVVDATVAQAAGAAPGPAVILTSDVSDMERLAGLVGGAVRALRV